MPALSFKGIAHPPPRRDGKRNNLADLNGAEIATSRAGNRGLPGRPVLVEHDHAGGQVGRVLTSWEGPMGDLRVEGVLDDPAAVRQVKSGRMRELSLGTSVHQDMSKPGTVMSRSHDELSICEKAARPGCIITEINGRQVGSTHHFSKPRGVRCSRYVDKPLAPSYWSEDQPAVAMSDLDSAAATTNSAPVAESFSAEYVAQLKKELEAERTEKMSYKGKYAAFEDRQRATLAEMQPAVKDWIKEGLEAGAEFKHEMEAMTQFGDNLDKVASLESAFPLARMISCHSAKIKREREEFSQSSGASEKLGEANKKIDALTEELETAKKRNGELEGLVNERTAALETSQDALAKAGLVKEKHDFSLAASRESAPATGTTGAMGSKAAAAPFVDPLFAYVSKGGSGSGRIGLSASNHHILGAGGAGDQGIEAALRMA